MRLRVVQRRVECPFGRNDGLGGRYLADCYIDSITPGHPCRDPQNTGATRCPQVAVFAQTLGLRTHKIEPEETTVNLLGEPHQEHRVNITYHPLDLTGERWYAMNSFTGERFEVVLHEKAPHRRTPEGEDIEQRFEQVDSEELERQLARGGMVNMTYTQPIWSGAPPLDQHRCRCSSCVGPLKEKLMNKCKKSPDGEHTYVANADMTSRSCVHCKEDEYESVRDLMVDPYRRTTSTSSYPSASVTPRNLPLSNGRTMSMYGDRKVPTRPVSHDEGCGLKFGSKTHTTSRPSGPPPAKKRRRDENLSPGSIVSEGFKEMTKADKTATSTSTKTTDTASNTRPSGGPPPMKRKRS